MPTVSVFYGIVVMMFHNEHPPPHFHVRLAEHRARVAIAGGEVVDGGLSPRAARMIREWADLHREELDENWRRAEELQPLARIEPLP